MTVDWVTVVVSVAINTPAVGGLFQWLGKSYLQKKMNEHRTELEGLKTDYAKQLESYKNQLNESKMLLQAEISKTILVTRVHFETEFEALKAVFAKLAEVKLQMAGIRGQLDAGAADESLEGRAKRLQEQINAFQKAYNGLLETTEHLSAFYPREIHQELQGCLTTVKGEIEDLRRLGPDTFSLDWYERGRTNLNEFLARFGEVSTLIRERISKLAIVRVG